MFAVVLRGAGITSDTGVIVSFMRNREGLAAEKSAIRAAIVLAGGEGTRLGHVNKGLLRWRGDTLSARWSSTISAYRVPAIFVGPESLRTEIGDRALLIQEWPSGGGPGAGIRAGMQRLEELGVFDDKHDDPLIKDEHPVRTQQVTFAELNSEPSANQGKEADTVPGASTAAQPHTSHVLIAAVDVVDPESVVDWLINATSVGDEFSVLPVDTTGRIQFLCSTVRWDHLLEAIRQVESAHNTPVKNLFKDLPQRNPVLPVGLGEDIDTHEDAARHGIEL